MRLLLVEDYLPLQKSIARGLREEGYAVDVTGDGEEGLWYAQGHEYDVIILDLMLPGLDGLSLLRRLRRAGNPVHVLILTARDAVEERVAGLDAGADDYLVKPFAFEELLARLRSLLRRRYDEKDPVLSIGALKIDTQRRRVWRGSEEIALTGKEYALLEYLVRRVDETVSRSEIWEHVYDFHNTATSNVVDVYIGYLRRKLQGADGAAIIHTVRGRGYCLKSAP